MEENQKKQDESQKEESSVHSVGEVISRDFPLLRSNQEKPKNGKEKTPSLPPKPDVQVCGTCGSEKTVVLRHDGRINGHASTRRNSRGVDLTPQFYKNVRWDHVCRPCVIKEREKEKAESEESSRRIAVHNFKRKSNIKPKYENVTFDNFSTTADKLNKRSNAKLIYSPEEIRSINRIHGIVKDWAGNFKENRKTGKFITFLGNPGTGKTHLACAAINRVIEHNCCSALIMSVQTIFMNIKRIYSEKGDELAYLEKMANLGLLVIEEVGIQKDSDWEFEKMNWIISERVDRLNPTIVISNLDASDFEDVIGSRMWDRLCGEDNETLMFDWRSFR